MSGNRRFLRPKPIRTHERAVELGRKGGRAKSKAKTAANIRKGLKTASQKTKEKWLRKLVTDPTEHAMLIEGLALEINKMDLDESQKIKLLQAWAAVHRAIHPASVKIQGEMSGTYVVKWLSEGNNNPIPSTSLAAEIPQQRSTDTPDAGGNKRGQDAGAGK